MRSWSAARALLALAVAGVVALKGCTHGAPGVVSVEGTGFVLDGVSFHVVGANQYNLLTAASFGASERASVTGLLDNAQSLGLNVVRMWGFCDGQRAGALQPRAGEFDERVFAGLDWVLAEAAKRDVRLIICFTNYWDDFGGIKQYVSWAQDAGEQLYHKEDFYTSQTCRRLYLQFVTALVTRVNTVSGVAYASDPTVFAWELINEARTLASGGDALQGWIEDMSASIKALDPGHLVTTGLEGFFGPSTPWMMSENPYSGANAGTDFSRNHAPNSIDFATLHIYSDQWLKCDFGCQLAFLKRWYSSHLEECQRMDKPLLLEEFGYKRGEERDAFFSTVYDISYGSAQEGGAAGGDLFWLLAGSPSVSDYDGYTVYAERDWPTTDLVRGQVQRMRNIDRSTALPTPPPPVAPPSPGTPDAPLLPGAPDAPPSPGAPDAPARPPGRTSFSFSAPPPVLYYPDAPPVPATSSARRMLQDDTKEGTHTSSWTLRKGMFDKYAD